MTGASEDRGQDPTRSDVFANRPPPPGSPPLAGAAAIVIGAFLLVVAIAWTVTILTAGPLMTLLTAQLAGAAPVDRAIFAGLVGVMMLAMMLPAAIPMLLVFRSVSLASGPRAEANLRSVVFGLSYFLVWGGVAAAALVALMAFGFVGPADFPLSLLPGAVLVAAGAYQFTSGKKYCLSQCRTPIGFVLTHWRGGRSGAARMGIDHALYCLGCCWLLMGVVFVTGAMSLLWMGVFSGIVLAEKVWERGEWFSRLFGAGAVTVGGLLLAFAFTAS